MTRSLRFLVLSAALCLAFALPAAADGSVRQTETLQTGWSLCNELSFKFDARRVVVKMACKDLSTRPIQMAVDRITLDGCREVSCDAVSIEQAE